MPIMGGFADYPTRTFVGVESESGGSNPTNFTSVSLGSGTANDLMVVTIGWNNGSDLSSATIDGNSATIDIQGVDGSNPDQARCAIISATATASSSGNIVLNFSGTAPGGFGVDIGIYRVKNLDSHTVYDVDQEKVVSAPIDLVLDVPDKGIVFAVGSWDNGGTTTMTGVTKDWDETTHSGGSAQRLSADSSYDVQLSIGGGAQVGNGAVWR